MRLGEASEQDRQRRLHGLDLELALAESLHDIAQVLTDVAAIVLGATSVRLWSVEREVARLVDREYVAVELEDAFQPIAQVVATGVPLWSARLSSAGEVTPRRRVACVLPLVDGEVIGVVELAFPTTHGFTVEDRQYLSAVAEQIAAAVKRARVPVWASGSTRIEVIEQVRRCVLVVDDDPDAAARFSEALEARGHEVVFVFNAQAALRIAEQYVADVAFVDVGLSSSNAYDLAAQLGAMPCWDTTRYIAVAANQRSNARERARTGGFDALVVKPLAPEVVDELISRSRHH